MLLKFIFLCNFNFTACIFNAALFVPFREQFLMKTKFNFLCCISIDNSQNCFYFSFLWETLTKNSIECVPLFLFYSNNSRSFSNSVAVNTRDGVKILLALNSIAHLFAMRRRQIKVKFTLCVPFFIATIVKVHRNLA
jgi:hypothetical protein